MQLHRIGNKTINEYNRLSFSKREKYNSNSVKGLELVNILVSSTATARPTGARQNTLKLVKIYSDTAGYYV